MFKKNVASIVKSFAKVQAELEQYADKQNARVTELTAELAETQEEAIKAETIADKLSGLLS